MTIEDQLAELREQNAAILAELRGLRAERQHDAGRWATRAEAAEHLGVSLDTIDARLRDGGLQGKRLGDEPREIRRDKMGRRIDRRPVRIWLDGPPVVAEARA